MAETPDQQPTSSPIPDEAEKSRHTCEHRYLTEGNAEPASESNRPLDPGLRRGDGLNPQWSEQIETLRANGTAERHPVRFAYLEALTRRAATQPEPVRALLDAKIQEAILDLAAPPTDSAAETPNDNASNPLADLLAYITQHANEQPEAPQLRSIARFQDTWARLSTEQQLTQTLAQAPANAGPMNSQHLILRSLQRMQDIAPDYLQCLMSYVDALIWLESADPTKLTTARPSTGEADGKRRSGRRSGATNR